MLTPDQAKKINAKIIEIKEILSSLSLNYL